MKPGDGSRALGPWAPAALLLVVAAALRFHRLGDADLWWDEALAVWAVRKPLLEATAWTASDVHPPLFFWLLWAWRRLAGESELALRALVAWQGVLLAAVAFALGRRVGGRRGGPWALALVALSPLLVWWSQELRMYGTAALALALAAYATCRWAAEPPGAAGRRWLAAYAAAAAATLHAVYLAGAGLVALVAAVALGAALGRLPARALRPWLAANAAVGLAFAPWALYAGSRMSSWRTAAEGTAPGFVAELWAALLAHGTSTDIAVQRWATAAYWLCAALAAAAAWTRGSSRSGSVAGRAAPGPWLLAGFLVVPPALVWLATQPRSLFYSPSVEARYFVPFAAPVHALLGAWLGRATRPAATGAAQRAGAARLRGAGWAAGLGMLALGAAFLPGHYAPRRRTAVLDAMALAIWSQAEPDDVVLLVSGNRYPMFLYHYERAWDRPVGMPRFEHPAARPPDPADRPQVVPFPDRGSDALGEGWEERLAAAVEGRARVWLVAFGRDLQDPHAQVEAWLAARFGRVLSEGYGPDALHLFARDGEPPVVTALSSRWPGAVWLGRVHDALGATGTWLPLGFLPTRRAAPGDALELVLFSSGDERPAPQRAWLHAWLDPRTPIAPRAGPSFTEAGDAPDEAVLRHRFTVPIDARTPGGSFDLIVRPADGQGAAPGLPVEVVGAYPLVGGRARQPYAQVAGYVLGEVRLASDHLRPGQPLYIDLMWRPLDIDRPGGAGPTVFAHLVGPPRAEGDAVWAVDDGPPSVGGWDLGDGPLFDRHVLVVPPDAPPGDYAVEVGMYDAATGARHAVEGSPHEIDAAGRRVRLGSVRVGGRPVTAPGEARAAGP